MKKKKKILAGMMTCMILFLISGFTLARGSEPETPTRFVDNNDGTVIDNQTELVWLKNASCFGQKNWATALADCNDLESGECGLSDGSKAGDWRLPNRFELESLLAFDNYNPALPAGHPFIGVQPENYWSSTTSVNHPGHAWYVHMNVGPVYHYNESSINYVWPVRRTNN